VGDEDQRPLVAVERGFELLDGGQVEMVRGLVEDEAVHASQRELGESRAGAFPGREAHGWPRHVIGPETELGELGPGFGHRHPRRSLDRVEH